MNDERQDRVLGVPAVPLAPRARRWNATAAERRVRRWAGAQGGPNARYARAFLFVDQEDRQNFGAYKLQIADVVDGELRLIPRAVFAVAGVLAGARGGVDVPEGDRAGLQRAVSRVYARMRREFDDPRIIPPWER